MVNTNSLNTRKKKKKTDRAFVVRIHIELLIVCYTRQCRNEPFLWWSTNRWIDSFVSRMLQRSHRSITLIALQRYMTPKCSGAHTRSKIIPSNTHLIFVRMKYFVWWMMATIFYSSNICTFFVRVLTNPCSRDFRARVIMWQGSRTNTEWTIH